MKNFLITSLLFVIAIAVLALWSMPFVDWRVALALLGLLAAWLFLTKSGRRTLQITGMGVRSLPQRWGESLVIIVGIAGVVGVLVAMQSMGEGLKKTLAGSGDDSTIILLRSGSQAETNSSISRDLVPRVANLSGFSKGPDGKPLISAELSQIVNMRSIKDDTDTNVQFRGVGPQAFAVRPQLKIVEGRKFTPGTRELIGGVGASKQFRGLVVNQDLKLGNQTWKVVGLFQSGDSHESELWADSEVLGPAFQRPDFQSMTGRIDGKAGLDALKKSIAADPQLKFDVQTTKAYFGKQSEGLSKGLSTIGGVIAAIMAIGAVFGALNSMYAAVAGRAREIATMRALGFTGAPVITALMLETMFLALVGGLLGAGIAWLLFNGSQVSTMGSNFSQVVFKFTVTPLLVWSGLKWALAIGFLGGFFPALRAARMKVTDALRAL